MPAVGMGSHRGTHRTRVLAVDWSGRAKDERDHLWLAEADAGGLRYLEGGRLDRRSLVDHLVAVPREHPRTVVGFDFAFSLPAWYAQRRGWTSAREVWTAVREEAEYLIARCEAPFWGRPGRREPNPPDRRLRRTEEETGKAAGFRPKSVFQISGPGAVGTGSLRGMAHLSRLAAAGFSIWPFDPPAWPRAVEIYPRLLTGKVVKSSRAARERHLERYAIAAPVLRERAICSEDAFDAAVSAIEMARHVGELEALEPARDEVELLEGRIWRPAGP